jgi:hypothetical protein
MPKTWSNAKNTDTRSAAQRLRERPAYPVPYVIGLIVAVLFFAGLLTYTTLRVTTHPLAERPMPAVAPKD